MSTHQAPETADVFCTVVDNFGDAGIAWRLARALARDYGFQVRLFIDDITPLAKMKPNLDPTKNIQTLDGVEIHIDWSEKNPARLVIETLAASVPDDYLHAMADAPKKPVWILYEYLSAEDWVEGTHLKPSPHPRLPLTKFFFYPGFTARTGGLLGEPYIQIAEPPPQKINRIFLFAYENDDLFKTWLPMTRDIQIDVPEGRALNSIRTVTPTLPVNFNPIPFVDQDELIKSLGSYDLNIVRGEDSLTAAVLTGRPLIWHIYPQDEDAHLTKLRAFLARYTAHLSPRAAKAVTGLNLAWNGAGDIAPTWQSYLIDFNEISEAAANFARQMRQNGDAVQNLVDFYRQKR